MIKLDRSYSDYTELTDPNYPNGKAVDCSTDESYDGTPILKELVNDLHGALEAVVKQSAGNISGVSGNPDNINASDFKDALMDLIETPDAAHAALRGPDTHGATVAATPGQLMTRDTNGRAQVANPSADADIANKGFVESASTTGNAATATTLENSRDIDGMSFNGSASITHFGTCTTDAGTKEKTVAIAGFSLATGSRITVKFTNGNTSGSAKGTSSNKIAVASAPTLNVNSTGAKTIYVGGEPAGEGFINSGDVHDFVYDGTNWCDVTADVIYKGGSDSTGYYEKERNGFITQFKKITSTTLTTDTWTYSIPFTIVPVAFGIPISNSQNSIQYRYVCQSVSKTNLVFMGATTPYEFTATGY